MARLLPIGLLATFAAFSNAQDARRSCLSFDRAYFTWQYRSADDRWVSDSSALIALDTDSVRGPAGARRLDPLPRGGVDTWSKSLWAPSHWRSLGVDSIEILWTTLLTGSHFVLAGRDTLTGTVRDFSDVVAVDKAGHELPEPPPRRITAFRTPCGSTGPSTAADSTALAIAIYLVALSNGTMPWIS